MFNGLSKPLSKESIEKKDELLDIIKDKYKDNLEALVLFGSITRPDFSINSDIDMFIILQNTNLSFRKRIYEFYEKLGYYFEEHFLSPIILNIEESKMFHPFYLGIFDSYITLYDKGNHIYSIVHSIEQKIASKDIKELNYPKKHWIITNAKA